VELCCDSLVWWVSSGLDRLEERAQERALQVARLERVVTQKKQVSGWIYIFVCVAESSLRYMSLVVVDIILPVITCARMNVV
jgi:hypothetical protein